MPKISRVFIRLDGEKEVYRHGEMVQGTVSLEVAESFQIRSVRIFRYGEALTKWDPLFEKKVNVAKERYLGHYVTLFGNKAGENSKPYVTLAAGKQNYKFSFRLPSNGLASSFEGDNGAVRYWLTVVVATPTFSFDQKWYRCITVLEEIDVNKPVYKVPVRRGQEKTVSKALGLGNAGTLVLNAECDRKAYCPGEKIALNVLVKNNTTKDMGKLKARISQNSVFKANGESVSSDTHIRIIEGESSIGAGQERKWENQLLVVDALPPSSTNISCHIIEVRYYVKVWVEVPWGTDLSVTLPIIIGTVPLKQNTPSQPVGAASNALEIDTSKALCYSKCNHGVSHCGRSDGVFPNLNYVPMCTYVPNYQFSSLAAAQLTPKAIIKGKIPPAYKSVPTVSTTASNVPVNSSVMPVLPPSYEEVLQMNSQKAKPEAAVVCELPKSDQFGLFIRFQDSYIAEFRSYIMQNRQYLKEREGELLALSVQPISEPGIWPEQTSIAIFVFASAEKASDWFKTAPGINETSWMKSCDAATLKMNELHNRGK
ncbi:arrestin domain-containing protein 3 [Patella vulgata]|uniref:arrestin domain-containing protein 3 n=1 Tax=Patella vulgata TaxID=6465 RepID=UPI00217F890C|nr:arrestin domain-containing protein 3 [Patella vulgata]